MWLGLVAIHVEVTGGPRDAHTDEVQVLAGNQLATQARPGEGDNQGGKGLKEWEQGAGEDEIAGEGCR